MKSIFCLICLVVFTSLEAQAQTEFELTNSQSMLMTGKGPGQDATINPYDGEDCMAIVENIGQEAFSIRIQQKGTIIKEVPILKGETKKVNLPKGHELYLDSTSEAKAKARVSYKKMTK